MTTAGVAVDNSFHNRNVLASANLFDSSYMLLGPTGCAKTKIWETLAGTHNLGKEPKHHTCIYETVNPKSVTGDELYGYMTLAKDWKDGVLSIIMRGMSKCFSEQRTPSSQVYLKHPLCL